MKVDPGAREMNWGGGSMKLPTSATAEEELYVALVEGIELETYGLAVVPRKIVDLEGRIVRNTGDQLVEGRPEFIEMKNVAVARAVIDGNPRKVPLQLMNIGTRKIKLRKGTRIGRLEPFDSELVAGVRPIAWRVNRGGTMRKRRRCGKLCCGCSNRPIQN